MESLANDLSTMVRTPLAEAHVRAMRRVGEERTFKAGDVICRPGDPQDTFIYID